MTNDKERMISVFWFHIGEIQDLCGYLQEEDKVKDADSQLKCICNHAHLAASLSKAIREYKDES